eukprot:1378822-Amorphochlora_amoeboformis.AAC.1
MRTQEGARAFRPHWAGTRGWGNGRKGLKDYWETFLPTTIVSFQLPPLNDSAREQKRSPVEPEDDAKLSGTAGSNSIDGLHYTPVPKAR